MDEKHVFTPAMAVLSMLKENELRPYLLIDPRVKSDLEELDTENPNCVVLGDAMNDFNHENMNKAFRILMKGTTKTLSIHPEQSYFPIKLSFIWPF